MIKKMTTARTGRAPFRKRKREHARNKRESPLSDQERRNLLYWMRLTRTLDDRLVALWKQGRGVGGTFNQRGHEAISVGAGAALEPDDIVAPIHRDLGCYLIRGMTPRRIVANQLGRASGVTRGRDANLHGCGDMSLGIIGFVSHIPQSLGPALGAAMSFTYRGEERAALTFLGDGGTTTGTFHEVLNMAAVRRAPLVVVVENNQYAYSTPLRQSMAGDNIPARSEALGVPAEVVDGNDLEAVYGCAEAALRRARAGGGPSLIEAKTMRMLGHAIHDGAEYVPPELLAEWEKKDPVARYERKLLAAGIVDEARLKEITDNCRAVAEDAVEFAEADDWPDPASVEEGVFA